MTTRRYEGDGITVLWDSTRCIHTAICLRALPEVFDTGARPWVDVTAATADEIAAAIAQCPSGALAYERDGRREEGDPVATITPIQNGPLALRGRFEVRTGEGDLVMQDVRMTLCRCGGSANQPFCDNTHRDRRFESRPPVSPPERADAETPVDICAPQNGFTAD